MSQLTKLRQTLLRHSGSLSPRAIRHFHQKQSYQPAAKRQIVKTLTTATGSSTITKRNHTNKSHKSNDSPFTNNQQLLLLTAAATLTAAAVTPTLPSSTTLSDSDYNPTTTLLNWSGTHETTTSHYHEPSTPQSLLSLVKSSHLKSLPIRPVGSALSPNAIAFHPGGMISLAELDDIISIDVPNRTVTVQAGARVSHVLDALRPHNLTLPNLASIAEQQMGGFTQVGAHGTGAGIPPVDEFVTRLRLVTPKCGEVVLEEDTHGGLFRFVRVGLG
eukprot:CAMPEP_0172500076 /NCGR_PEP_ID=MMETSP1066-20121228/134379_1 /TAXON_ID=671091 /ORGANISM="Coscinodiscus wailesii, Strain CCMP2513" /LENGTH=273 /DNA_ID=CAMNT_0013274149 /DNA_START=123 /DNA_END=940 /DNA_ORIENTATION=+